MALNFNLLNPDLPGQIAGSFQQGYQGAQDRANVLAQRQQQNQLNQMQIENALRVQKDTEAERAAYGSTDPMEVANRLRQAGLGKQAFDFESTLVKNQAERRKQKLEQAKTTVDLFKKTASGVMSNPSQYRSAIEQFGRLTGADVTNDLNEFDQIYATQGAEGVRKRAAAYALDADKLLPQFKTVDLGGVSRQLVIDPLTGEPVSSTDIKKTMTPGEAERINLERRRVQLQETNTNQIDRVVTDESGATRFFNKFGQEITPTGTTGQSINIQGKPSAAFEKTREQQKQTSKDVNSAINELTEITKPGGLIDQSTGSGAGKLIDIGARFVGQATPGDIAIKKLQPIADIVLKMVPRFEGPQSDKDTASYKEAAGQLADPSLPREIRKAAGVEILRLMKQRQNQFVTQSMANEGILPPSGATTLTPEDRQALNWANSNPKDPRALQIKQRLGQ